MGINNLKNKMEPRRFSSRGGGGTDQLPKPRLIRKVKRADELTLERQRQPPCPPRRDAAAPLARALQPRLPRQAAAADGHRPPAATREPPARRRHGESPFLRRSRKKRARASQTRAGGGTPKRPKAKPEEGASGAAAARLAARGGGGDRGSPSPDLLRVSVAVGSRGGEICWGLRAGKAVHRCGWVQGSASGKWRDFECGHRCIDRL